MNIIRPIGQSARLALLAFAGVFAFRAAGADTITFALDTTGGDSAARNVSQASDIFAITYKSGETVTVKNPRTGGTKTLVSNGTADGTTSFNPFTTDPGVGGTWELANSSQGAATFTMPDGEGTRESPYGLYTQAQLNAKAANGFYYYNNGTASLSAPDGYTIRSAGGNLFYLTKLYKPHDKPSVNGAMATFFLDTTGTVDGNTTTRTLADLDDLFPILCPAGETVNVTAPVSKTLATTTSDDWYDWIPDASGTWTLQSQIDGTTYTATFDLKTVSTTTVAAKIGSATYASLAEAVAAAGTDGSKTVVLVKADSSAITLGAVGNVLKIDTSSAAYSGTVKTSVTNAKVVSSKSGNVTTYTVKWDFSKAKVTVGGTWTYDGTQKKPAVGNLTVTFNNATLAQSGNWSIGAYGANVNAGNGTVTVTGAGAYDGTASGTFTIGKATLTVTAKAKTITYGDAPANAGVTYDGFVNGETENVLGGSLAYDYTYSQYGKPGGYAITPKGLTSDNYALTFVKGTLTVNKAALTATAEDKSVTYGAAAPAYTVKYSGWKGSDGVGRLSTAPTATAAYTTTTAVGTYDITVSGGASDYYTLAYVKGKLTVTKAASKVTVTAKSGLVYSGAAQDLVTQSGLSGGTIAYTLDGAAGTAAIPTGTVPKTYTVAWKVTGDANHGDTSGSTTVTISGTVAGAKTITLGSGVTVSIPSGVTVTVSEAQAATVPANGTVTVAANAARAEVTGAATVAKAGGVTLGTGGKAVYLYKNQTELDAIKAIAAPAYTGGKLKIKAVAQ